MTNPSVVSPQRYVYISFQRNFNARNFFAIIFAIFKISGNLRVSTFTSCAHPFNFGRAKGNGRCAKNSNCQQ